jgi:transcriptional regulator with XRE-family HTH domain
MTFARAIRAWRESEGWTQVEMARVLGVSRANLCDFEKGRKLPGPGRAWKMARKVGMVEPYVVQLVLQDILRREKVPCLVEVKGAG